MKLLFSIVSHDQAPLVQKLLSSFDHFLKCELHEVRIVITENSSIYCNVSSKNFIVEKIINLRQRGFGGNHNSVFEKVESDLFFIVNPDILLTSDFDLDHIVEQLMNDKIDIASPRIVGPTGAIEDYKRADLNILNLLKRKFFKETIENFEWFAGIFIVVNSRSFRTLQGFDTDFFMYVEDCDLSMRARKLGMKLEDIKDYSVVHDAQRATAKSIKHFRWHVTSLLRYWFLK